MAVPYAPLDKVAGHTNIYCDTQGWIYKEYEIQEANFYDKARNRPNLLPFLPKYGGLHQIPTSALDRTSEPQGPKKSKNSEMAKQDQAIVNQLTALHGKLSGSQTLSEENVKDIHAEIKHLSLKRIELGCNQTVLKKKTAGETRFLQLENVIFPYKRPFCLDLKLGIRQHRDNASAEKATRMTSKCKYTTSFTLGIRLSGVEAGGQCFDKYYGRTLSDDQFKVILKQYFLDKRCDALQFRFREVLKNENHCRLYSSSLFFVYEGSKKDKMKQDFRLIDFGHAYLDNPAHEGATFGLTNLIEILAEAA